MSMSTNAKVVIGLSMAAALVIGVVVASQEEDPVAPGSAGPPPISTPYPWESTPAPVVPSPAPAAGGCQYEDGFGTELRMTYGTGEVNPDLVMCTDTGQTGAVVKNVSDSTVYYVSQGYRGSYWTEDTDRELEADVRMFRAAVRTVFSDRGLLPALTIEPGESVRFEVSPGTLQLRTDVQQQAAWRTAVLQAIVYEQAKEQATERVEDFFEKRTPTGAAALTCTLNAYSVGKTIGSTVNDPSSLLFENVYDSGKGTYDCASALANAERASQQEGRAPVLNKQTLVLASRQPIWKQPTNSGFRTVLKIGSAVAQAR